MGNNNKRLGRGLQDFSHLFLSKGTDKESRKDSDQLTERPASETAITRPYSIAITCRRRSIANCFLTFNLCVSFAKRGLRVMVLNADLSFSSINLFNILEKPEAWSQPALSDISAEKNISSIRLITLDMDITVLHSPWPQEQNPVFSELTKSGQSVDVILINTSIGFSANAKAIFKAADETILLSGLTPARLIDTYSIAKTIIQISNQASVGIVFMGNEQEALKGFEKMNEAANQFLKRSLYYYGSLPADPDIEKSIREKIPFSRMKPDSLVTSSLENITETLLKTKIYPKQSEEREEPLFMEKLLCTSGQSMRTNDTLILH